MFKAIAGWFNRLLEKIGDTNQKEMGSKRMDCCDLNQDNKKKS